MTWFPANQVKPNPEIGLVLLAMSDGHYITGHYAPNGKWVGFAGNQSPPFFEIGDGLVKFWSPISPAPGFVKRL